MELSRRALAWTEVRRIIEERAAEDVMAALDETPAGRAFRERARLSAPVRPPRRQVGIACSELDRGPHPRHPQPQGLHGEPAPGPASPTKRIWQRSANGRSGHPRAAGELPAPDRRALRVPSRRRPTGNRAVGRPRLLDRFRVHVPRAADPLGVRAAPRRGRCPRPGRRCAVPDPRRASEHCSSVLPQSIPAPSSRRASGRWSVSRNRYPAPALGADGGPAPDDAMGRFSGSSGAVRPRRPTSPTS